MIDVRQRLYPSPVNYHLTEKARIEAGAWRYTAAVLQLVRPSSGHDQGGYAAIEGPVPGIDRLSAWLRLGLANGNVQPVKGYMGGGVVFEGPLASRPNDRLGIAISRAVIGTQDDALAGVSRAETSVEATYQVKLRETFAIQPDVQYVIDPPAGPKREARSFFGLRLVATGGYPKKAPAADATDPTVPPEGPQPTDGG